MLYNELYPYTTYIIFQGAFWGLMIGLVIGLTRFIWEYVYSVPPCGEGEKDIRPDIISKVHYLHFGILLFGIVFIATTVISLLTAPIDDCHVSRTILNWLRVIRMCFKMVLKST